MTASHTLDELDHPDSWPRHPAQSRRRESEYERFLAGKEQMANMGGFEPYRLPAFLYPFQRMLVDWSVRHGRCAIFADCGMGKTPMELIWADNVHRHTGKPVLLITPLAVGAQIEAEAHKFRVDAQVSRDGSTPAPVTITNYERLEKFSPEDFGGVVCDESSAIKSFDGVRRAQVTEFLRMMPYRLLGTATAAPNDYTELGTSSEALGQLGHIDMLNRYFVNDNRTSDTRGKWKGFGAPRVYEPKGWRFKGHAEEPFWRWVSSWARAIRKPSDYGFDDGEFILPPLVTATHVVKARTIRQGMLFEVPAIGWHEEREEQRRTTAERCEMAAALMADTDSAVIWCNLNAESNLVTKLIPGAVEVSGADSIEEKEEKLQAFSAGQIRHLVTKPKIGAWGLNWQHCNRMALFPSHSYEQYYQAVRRSWRFGQKRPVTIDIITTEGGLGILENLQRKATQADGMFEALVRHMSNALNVSRSNPFQKTMEVPSWL